VERGYAELSREMDRFFKTGNFQIPAYETIESFKQEPGWCAGAPGRCARENKGGNDREGYEVTEALFRDGISFSSL